MSLKKSDQPPPLSHSTAFHVESAGHLPGEDVLANASRNDRTSSDQYSSPEPQPSSQFGAVLAPLDTTAAQTHPVLASPHIATPVSAGLRIQTDHLAEKPRYVPEGKKEKAPNSEWPAQQTVYNAGLPVRSSSIRSVYGSRPQRTGSLSPGSVMSSPGVGPLVDMTPLPSPISLWGSPKLWKRSTIDDETEKSANVDVVRELSGGSPQFTHFTRTPSKKRKVPTLATGPNSQEAHSYNVASAYHIQNRSINDDVSDGLPIPKARNVTSSTPETSNIKHAFSPPDDVMHREQYLAIERGLAIPKPPTPPDSNCDSENLDQDLHLIPARPSVTSEAVVYEARTLRRGQMKRWQTLRKLGKGEFSTVYLATSEFLNPETQGKLASKETKIEPKSLVAVKVAEHGPAGGADEQKVETSIRREVDLMKSINHPSVVHLMAVNEYDRRTIIVENYCAGGDLFDLASQNLHLLTPPLIRRIFAELVAAVRYLHLQYIVHRDIKLESKCQFTPQEQMCFANGIFQMSSSIFQHYRSWRSQTGNSIRRQSSPSRISGLADGFHSHPHRQCSPPDAGVRITQHLKFSLETSMMVVLLTHGLLG